MSLSRVLIIMRPAATRPAIVAGIFLACVAQAAVAQRPSCLERYGLGGYVQSVGLRHGFRVETVAVDSPADRDKLRAGDVIVKVDGEEIRSYEHMRAVLAEAHIEGGEMEITYLRGSSLEQHTMKGNLRPASKRRPADDDKPVAKRRRPASDEDSR